MFVCLFFFSRSFKKLLILNTQCTRFKCMLFCVILYLLCVFLVDQSLFGRGLNAKKHLYAYSQPSEIKNLSCLVLSGPLARFEISADKRR